MSSCCHATPVVASRPDVKKRVAFIGQPNTGKSTFFNRITNAGAGVANWPGLTVDLLQAVVEFDQEPVEFVDLPGIYDLNGFTEDEQVVQRFLETYAINLIVVVLNASQVDRQLRMPLQIKSLGLPGIVMLNMADEAKRYGVQFDPVKLSERLGMPVFSISAKYGTGCSAAIAGIAAALNEQSQSYQVQNLLASLAADPVTDTAVVALGEGAVQMPSIRMRTLTNRIDSVMMHPFWGLPAFLGTMLALFWIIWSIGIPSADPVDAVTGWFQAAVLQPLISPLPQILQDLIINGIWAGFATLVSFVPLVALFFVLMGILEDSGYLSRAAYLMDALMEKVGLDGRAFVLQMMGFGCNVPAIMGTRVLRSPGMRLLAMLVIPFALCSARLQVFVFILAAVIPGQGGAIALFLLYVLSFVAAFGVAAIFSRTKYFRSRDPFALELPPYRFPTVKQILLKVWNEMKEFVTRLSVFMILGTTLVWLLTSFPEGSEGLETYAGKIGSLFSPIMAPLGINPLLTVSLIFGFVAKEIQVAAMAVIYGLSDDTLGAEISRTITFAQGFSYCLFALLYIPCLTTLGTIWAETRSLVYTTASVVLPLVIAWIVSFVFYQGFQLLGLGA